MLKSIRAILDKNETSRFLDFPKPIYSKQSTNLNAYERAGLAAKTNNKNLSLNNFALGICQNVLKLLNNIWPIQLKIGPFSVTQFSSEGTRQGSSSISPSALLPLDFLSNKSCLLLTITVMEVPLSGI